MKMPDMNELVNADDAAVIARVSERTIRTWKRRGVLAVSGLDDNRRQLFRVGDVLRAEAKTRRRLTNAARSSIQ